MADKIGRINVPDPINASGLTFPFTSDFPVGYSRAYPIIEHRFGDATTLACQRFQVGFGPRRFDFQKTLSFKERAVLEQAMIPFFQAVTGSLQSFIYNAPNPDGTTSPFIVIFENQPLTITHLASMCKTGFTLIEVASPSSAPVYSVTSTVTRFPTSALATALLGQVQVFVPLIHIRVRDLTVPDIYLSDRRVTVGGQLYLPRVLGVGEPGSDVIMSQDISGKADNVQFQFGNADRVMSQLAKDTSLKFASIDLCFLRLDGPTATSGILIQMWKGTIANWKGDGSSTFSISASDGLFPITQSYPKRTTSRYCWKTFNDIVTTAGSPVPTRNCPFQTSHGPLQGGNPGSCDFGYNTPNGCLAHGMSPYFGGQPAFPQSVVIKDNGTGTIGGFFRNKVTSTSIVSDSMWDFPLADIWCNDGGDPQKAYWANCIIAAVRDESDYEDVLGIVGAGPIGKYEGMSVQTNADGYVFLVSPLADGFPPQGFKVNGNLQITGYQPGVGLREVFGNDPVDPNEDFFALGQGAAPTSGSNGFLDFLISPILLIEQLATGGTSSTPGVPYHFDIPDPTFSNILTGQAHDILAYAAGTAIVEIRYKKSSGSGITPTTTESHNLVVPIAQGLNGVVVDPNSGSLKVVGGLTDPFWIAVNTYWRALGYDAFGKVSGTTLLSVIDLPSIAYASSIANLQVTPIVGDQSSTETQFQFQGTLSEFKPFRDWLNEILGSALGYFTFEFGQLHLGIRENASDSSAFTVGNMLYQSLSTSPAGASGLNPPAAGQEFEYLKIDFANVALQYQLDMAEYQDKDHAAYYGRAGAPLTARIRSAGISGISQALRVAVTRVREEVGGVLRLDLPNKYLEYDCNLNVQFKTTILALETSVGDVISVTHPDIPTYPGPPPGFLQQGLSAPNFEVIDNTWHYRIQKWTLHKDYSVTIQARSVTDSMYALDAGPRPADVLPSALPILFYPQPLGEWAPYTAQANPTDPLFPKEFTFDAALSYSTLADGTAQALVTLTGVLPVNTFLAGAGPPDIKQGQIQISQFGGQIPSQGGAAYFVAVTGVSNPSGQRTPPSDIVPVVFEGPTISSPTDTNSFTISDIFWPRVPGLTGYDLHVGSYDDLISMQQQGELTLVDPVNLLYSPTSITVPGPFIRSTWALPNPATSKVRVKVKKLIHGGVIGAIIDSVSGSTIVASDTADSAIAPGSPGFQSANPILAAPIDASQTSVEIYWNIAPTFGIPGLPPLPDVALLQIDSETLVLLTGSATPVSGQPYGFWNVIAVRGYNGTTPAAHVVGPATSPNYSGRYLILIGRAVGNVPYLSFKIESYDPVTGTFGVDRDAAAAGVLAGDVFVVSFQGYDNSTAPTTYSDPALSNPTNFKEFGVAGEVPHDPKRIGTVMRIIAGTNRGATAVVTDNGPTSYTFDRPILMDSTSVPILESAAWEEIADSADSGTADPTVPTRLSLPVANYLEQQILVAGFTVSNAQSVVSAFTKGAPSTGIESNETDAPFRMLYIYGQPNFLQVVDKVTFGLPDDSTTQGSNGINAAGYYGNVHTAGQPFTGSISTVDGPIAADTILDVQISKDNGKTWTSIFPGGNGVTYPKGTTGLIYLTDFAATFFGTVNVVGNSITWVSGDQFDGSMDGKIITINGVQVQVENVTSATTLLTLAPPGDGSGLVYEVEVIQFDIGDMLRINTLQSGGATGISMVVKWGVTQSAAAAATPPPSASTGGNVGGSPGGGTP